MRMTLPEEDQESNRISHRESTPADTERSESEQVMCSGKLYTENKQEKTELKHNSNTQLSGRTSSINDSSIKLF